MKKKIHPVYYDNAQVTCACGASFTTGSTQKKIHVDVCSKCHPVYTGKMKFVDTKGRVEKFKERQKKAEEVRIFLEKKQKEKLAQKKREEHAPKTLREMLLGE